MHIESGIVCNLSVCVCVCLLYVSLLLMCCCLPERLGNRNLTSPFLPLDTSISDGIHRMRLHTKHNRNQYLKISYNKGFLTIQLFTHHKIHCIEISHDP